MIKETLSWINAALADKTAIIPAMSFYRVSNNEITATNNNISAGCPWPFEGEFLVSGIEFEKVLSRITDDNSLKIKPKDNKLLVKSNKFSSTIETLPLSEWSYPGIDKLKWQLLPKDFLTYIGALQPFIYNKDDMQPWAKTIALEKGYMLVTNNIVVAGAKCDGLDKAQTLLPDYAVDFILNRIEGLTHWSLNEKFVAFKWKNGAWMRTNVINGKFDERAANMIRDVAKQKLTQKIDDEFREAFRRIAELAEENLVIYPTYISSNFGKAIVEERLACEVPPDRKEKIAVDESGYEIDSRSTAYSVLEKAGQLKYDTKLVPGGKSIWGARFLLPVILAADAWSPSAWPKPAPFRGKLISGYVTGKYM